MSSQRTATSEDRCHEQVAANELEHPCNLAENHQPISENKNACPLTAAAEIQESSPAQQKKSQDPLQIHEDAPQPTEEVAVESSDAVTRAESQQQQPSAVEALPHDAAKKMETTPDKAPITAEDVEGKWEDSPASYDSVSMIHEDDFAERAEDSDQKNEEKEEAAAGATQTAATAQQTEAPPLPSTAAHAFRCTAPTTQTAEKETVGGEEDEVAAAVGMLSPLGEGQILLREDGVVEGSEAGTPPPPPLTDDAEDEKPASTRKRSRSSVLAETEEASATDALAII